MPWRCPACRTHVQHTTDDPRSDRIYRCPVCRLQMIFDPVAKKMRPVPPNGNDDETNEPHAA